MRLFNILILALGLLLVLSACTDNENNAEPVKEVNQENEEVTEAELTNNSIELPALFLQEGSVAEALNLRVSQRSFSDAALDLSDAASLLWAAGGLKVDGETGPTRTSPSAGAAYPLDLYLVAGDVQGLATGIYRYDHLNHKLDPVVAEDRRSQLAEAALGQQFIADAPASIVLVAYFERSTGRYGERGERYVYMDTGYASQSIHLLAVELGLGTVAVGAFDDEEVAAVLETDGVPLKIMPVGRF